MPVIHSNFANGVFGPGIYTLGDEGEEQGPRVAASRSGAKRARAGVDGQYVYMYSYLKLNRQLNRI